MEQNNLILLACGLLGVFIHCLFKSKDLIDYAFKANLNFTFIDYLKKDWFAVSLSISSLAIWFFVYPEAANKYPSIANFIRFSFVVMGLFGSYIIQKFFSKGKTYISDIIDKKTNVADSINKFSEEGPGGSNPPGGKDEK